MILVGGPTVPPTPPSLCGVVGVVKGTLPPYYWLTITLRVIISISTTSV